MATTEKTPTFEAAMASLEEILAKLADPDVQLNESIELYARAADLVQQCNQSLTQAEVRIEEISAKLQEAQED